MGEPNRRQLLHGAAGALVVVALPAYAACDVRERIVTIVRDSLGVDAEKITDDAKFVDDLGADSLDTAEILSRFEEAFGEKVPEDVAETMVTVGAAVAFFEAKACA